MLSNTFVPHEKLGKIGIVMSGCGLRSVIHLGYLKSLVKHGLAGHVVYFFGVSGAALTLAAPSMAQSPEEFSRMLAYAEKEWLRIERAGPKSVFNFPDSWWKVPFSRDIHFKNVEGLFDNRVLYNLLGEYDPANTIRSPIRFDVRVFNHCAARYETVSNHDSRFDPARGGNPKLFTDFLVASACLDLFFVPVRIGDSSYSDGDSIEIVPAVDYGCDTIFVFSGHDKEYKASEGGSYAEIKKHAPRVIRGILNKHNALRQQDSRALEEGLRRAEQIREMRKQRREPKSFLGKAIKKMEKLKERFFRFVGLEAAIALPTIFEEKFPQIIHFYAADTTPKSLIPTSFKNGDITKGMEEAEKQFDAILEEMF